MAHVIRASRVTRAWRIGLLLCVMAGLMGAIRGAWAGDDATSLETRIKAAYLYKFSGYVEWPRPSSNDPTMPLQFGVMGDDALADELARLVNNRGAGARSMTVTKIRPFDSLPPLHILFIGNSVSDRMSQFIRVARTRHVLVVTDTDGALAQDSMINFRVVDGHVRFDVDLASAQRSGLVLSSRLLAVAHTVTTESP